MRTVHTVSILGKTLSMGDIEALVSRQLCPSFEAFSASRDGKVFVSNNSKTPVPEGCLTIRLTPMVSSLAAFREAEYQHTVCMLYLG